MHSAESEAEKQALRERIDQLMRSQQELESRATSLQLTVDRLTLALAKTEEEEQAFKDKVAAPDMGIKTSKFVVAVHVIFRTSN